MMDDNIRKWCLKLSFSFVRGVSFFIFFVLMTVGFFCYRNENGFYG
jgi:hypothetical protein